MITDARIIHVRQAGKDLILKMKPKSIPSETVEMIIKNFTHWPKIGQLMWGTDKLVYIEVGMGIAQRKYYTPNKAAELTEMSGNAKLQF